MYISKVVIENFKCFQGRFSLELNQELNILVGDNSVWKTTILEAIHLAFSWWIYGKYLWVELKQSLFNNAIIENYLNCLKTEERIPPPKIIIELYFSGIENDSIKALFEWNYNTSRTKACGISFEIGFFDSELNRQQYGLWLEKNKDSKSLPIEFYEYWWTTFARDSAIKPRIFNQYFNSTFIDSSNYRYQNGCDVEVLKSVKSYLSDQEKIAVSLAHRNMQDKFSADEAIIPINAKLGIANFSQKKLSLAVEWASKTAREDSLTVYVGETPFSNSGRWEQCIIKTKLALNTKKTDKSNVLLFEEPENHLSHSNLSKLINYISENYNDKQIIISTHSSFVANKLLLWNLIILNKTLDNKILQTKMASLSPSTQQYFSKISGYDTLRLILCEKAILVEWQSDELIVQRAYKDKRRRLPIEDGIDVISVGTSFLRFLELAEKVEKKIAVITDNDWDYEHKIVNKYHSYNDKEWVKICADKNNVLYTLEPQLIEVNKSNLALLRSILGVDSEQYSNEESLSEYMQEHKTDYALKIFDYIGMIQYPKYILDAINRVHDTKK